MSAIRVACTHPVFNLVQVLAAVSTHQYPSEYKRDYLPPLHPTVFQACYITNDKFLSTNILILLVINTNFVRVKFQPFNITIHSMDAEKIAPTIYTGTKKFTQHDVRTANATGFGAAADDYAERGIDLNEELIRNKPATFFFRMSGDAMIDAGIYDRDILIVDRSIHAANGKVVIAAVNGELLVRRLEKTINKIRLLADNKKLNPIEVQHDPEFSVWGVVTYTIHAM